MFGHKKELELQLEQKRIDNDVLKDEIYILKSKVDNLTAKNKNLESLKPPSESEKVKELENYIAMIRTEYSRTTSQKMNIIKRKSEELEKDKQRINNLIAGIKKLKEKNRQSDVSQLKNANNGLKNSNNELVTKLSQVEKKRDELEKALNKKRLSTEQKIQKERLRRAFRR